MVNQVEYIVHIHVIMLDHQQILYVNHHLLLLFESFERKSDIKLYEKFRKIITIESLVVEDRLIMAI
jgi:hypothetical protein